MKGIQKSLIHGIGMNRCHQASFYDEIIVQNTNNRGKAICSAGSVGDDMMIPGVVFLVIYPDHKCCVEPLTGSGHNYLLCSRIDVLLSRRPVTEKPGGFKNDLNTKLVPRQLLKIRYRKAFKLFTINKN